MLKHFQVLGLVLLSTHFYAQSKELKISDLQPSVQENKFPFFSYAENTKVEDKINTLLQLDFLEHLPNKYKVHPFEEVIYNSEMSRSSVHFYDYSKIKTPKNILTLSLNGEATGAYSEMFDVYYNFDLRTGKRVFIEEILSKPGIQELTKILNENVKNEMTDFIYTLKNYLDSTKEIDEEENERISAQVEMYIECIDYLNETTMDYYEFHFEEDSIAFVKGRCSNHAMRAIDDLDVFTFKFAYEEVKNYFTTYGLSLLDDNSTFCKTSYPAGKFYKGTINNKYPITVLVLHINSDHSLDMRYWYDKYRHPIKWDGNFQNKHFSLVEYDKYNEDLQTWIKQAKIEADLINDKIIGTWTNLKTNEVLQLNLVEY